MSESRKKSYKKRGGAAHIKQKEHVNTRKEGKWQKLLNEWMWLITLVAIAVITVLFIVLVPQCDEGGSCYNCQQSCAKSCSSSDVVTPSDAASYTDQLSMPAEGEQVAVIETSMGTMKLRLFPENAPETVANFKALAEQGAYDGTIFHRVVEDFMIQGGDNDGTADGSGGVTASGSALPDENNNGLYHFYGAISMANTGLANSGSSQFFIVQRDTTASANYFTADSLISTYGYDSGVASIYGLVGGTPELDYEVKSQSGAVAHTVFGQVYEGLDVLDKIAAVEVTANANMNNEVSQPVETVVVSKIYLETYHAPEVVATPSDVSPSEAQ